VDCTFVFGELSRPIGSTFGCPCRFAGRGIVARLRREVAPRQDPADIAEIHERVGAFGRAFREIRQGVVIRASRSQSSIFDRRISSVSVSTRIVSSIYFRPRQSRPSDGGQCDGGGGCIACDWNEEEECAALAAMQPTNGATWPQKDGFGAVGWRKLDAGTTQQVPVSAATASFGIE